MADQVSRADSPAPDMRWVFERLLAILDTAVSLQPETESVLRRCVTSSAPSNAVLARQAGRLTSALLFLVDRANALPGSLVVDEARGLLRYHHRLLTESLDHVFGPSAALGCPGGAGGSGIAGRSGGTGRSRSTGRPGSTGRSGSTGCSGSTGRSGSEAPFPDCCDCLGEPADRLRRLRIMIAADLSDPQPAVSPR